MLSADGYAGVSLRILTKNVGTSTNAVYTLFGSKEALLAEVIVRTLDTRLGPDFDPNSSADPEENLLLLARFYRDLAAEDPHAFTGAFEAMAEARLPGSLTDRINPEVLNIDKRIFAPLLDVCKSIAKISPDTGLQPDRMAISLWAAIHGYISLEIAGALPTDPAEDEEIFSEMIQALYVGWTARDFAEVEGRM